MDSSCTSIVERHVQCMQSPMHLVKSDTLSGSSQEALFSELLTNKRLQLLFAQTPPLRLRHSGIIVL